MRNRFIVGMTAASLVLSGLVVSSVQAAGDQSLTGSNFELEADANLKLDAAAPSFDWASVGQGSTAGTERRKEDKPTGGGDDSFGQGTKEDTAVPTVVDGSIPPNKSDLKFFGGVQEGTTSDGFLHLFWTRVQDPSGTTNMDFEFNRNKCEIVAGAPTADSVCSSNGVTPVRTANVDLLITYDLANGGTNAVLGKRTWLGTAWGPYTPFSATTARGTINTTAIPATESDGLGALSPRTFGEASIKLSSVLPTGTASCTGFGSAYLKSRSSDAFSAAVKDFIAPLAIDITNCGTVKIIKTDNAEPNNQPLAGAVFTLYNDLTPFGTAKGTEDTATTFTCQTAATTGTCSMTGVPFGPYWVVETTTPAGYTTAANQLTAISSGTPTVTLTFVNNLQVGTLTVIKVLTNNSGGTKTSATEFSFTRNGEIPAVAFDSDNTNGPYTYPAGTVIDVVENDYYPEYTTTYADNDTTTSTACIDMVIPNGANVTCTITNDDNKAIPVAQTTQTWSIKDSLTISGLRTGATNAAAATVTFELYKGQTCTAATKVGQEIKTGITNATVNMTNGIAVTETGYYSWIVAYSGDAFNEGFTQSCGDESTFIRAHDWVNNNLPQ